MVLPVGEVEDVAVLDVLAAGGSRSLTQQRSIRYERMEGQGLVAERLAPVRRAGWLAGELLAPRCAVTPCPVGIPRSMVAVTTSLGTTSERPPSTPVLDLGRGPAFSMVIAWTA